MEEEYLQLITGERLRRGPRPRSLAAPHVERSELTSSLRRCAGRLEGALSSPETIGVFRGVFDYVHAYYASSLDDPYGRGLGCFHPSELEDAFEAALRNRNIPALGGESPTLDNAVALLATTRAHSLRLAAAPAAWSKRPGLIAGWLHRQLTTQHTAVESPDSAAEGPPPIDSALLKVFVIPKTADTPLQGMGSPQRLQNLDAIAAACGSLLPAGLMYEHYVPYLNVFQNAGYEKINEKIARLVSAGAMVAADIYGNGLWSLTRSLARLAPEVRKAHALQLLKTKDKNRIPPYGLPGSLVEIFSTNRQELVDDEIRSMTDLIFIPKLLEGLKRLCDRRAAILGQDSTAYFLLKEALIAGPFRRGEAGRITGLDDRSARRVLTACRQDGLLIGKNKHGAVSLALPLYAVGFVLPGLLPLDATDEALRTGIARQRALTASENGDE